MSIQNNIDRITDILRRDDGISGAMHYTEQISWILFLKFLNDYEDNKADEGFLEGTDYNYVLRKDLRWHQWACPKDEKGKLDIRNSITSDDLTNYVNQNLFPYLKSFNDDVQDVKSVRYMVGNIFGYIRNNIANGSTLREVLNVVDTLNFQSNDEMFELSLIYETLLKNMGGSSDAGEFYTYSQINANSSVLNKTPENRNVTLVLQELWELEKETDNVSIENIVNNTQIVFTTSHGASIELLLSKKDSLSVDREAEYEADNVLMDGSIVHAQAGSITVAIVLFEVPGGILITKS